MGLKILHNGNISDYSGPEYDPGSYGRARLRIKINDASTAEYGLTSDLTASQYCKASFKVNGSTLRIGRRETRTSESAYTVSETLYTYTYQTTTTYQAGAYNYTYSGYREDTYEFQTSYTYTSPSPQSSSRSWNTTKVSNYTYYSGNYARYWRRTTQWTQGDGKSGARATYVSGPYSTAATSAAASYNAYTTGYTRRTNGTTTGGVGRTTWETEYNSYTTDIRSPVAATRQQNTTSASTSYWTNTITQTRWEYITSTSLAYATSYATRSDGIYTITATYSRSYYTYVGNQYTTLNSNPWYSSSIGTTRRTRPAEYTTHNFNV